MYNVKDIIDNYPHSFEEYDKLVAEIATVLHRHEAYITCYSLDTLNHGWGAFCADPKKYEGTVVVDMINQDLDECVPFIVTVGVDYGDLENGPIIRTDIHCVLARDEKDAEKKVLRDIERDFACPVEGYTIEKMSDQNWEQYLNDYIQY